MSDKTYLDWPFFDDAHRALALNLDAWAADRLAAGDGHADVDRACRDLVATLGEAGWLEYCVPERWGGRLEAIDSRSVCLARETLARHDGLADFAFGMQGLGSGAISLAGSDAIKERYLPRVARGAAIAAFALSEPGAGSDVAAMSTRARETRGEIVLDGTKTWISNGGIADFYTVFARELDAPGAGGISAFVVDADAPGLAVAGRIHVIAPHPLATLEFRGCRIPASQRLGAPGEGFKVAMQTLDIFRASVAAAALGFARRALDEAIERAASRPMFGQVLADFQLTQAAIADMATGIDSSALLTYRAAWLRDAKAARTTREAAMAKMVATETAQAVIDRAVQIFGGLGVVSGQPVEKLYREIRALRIYEGATEVQKLVIARETLKGTARHRPRGANP
jgi:acyl-CoA dehydrogenase